MNFELSRAKERKQLMSKDIHMRMNIGALKRFQMSLNMSRNKIVKSKWPLQKECINLFFATAQSASELIPR